ncbi:MAG: hypothetical protein K6253_01435, partial [Candidatus Liberibacter asiaticus]|nr:hypothetical protein [Candidatus Liberibacter asiaticus]
QIRRKIHISCEEQYFQISKKKKNRGSATNPKQVARCPPATPSQLTTELDPRKTGSEFTVPSIIQALIP